MNETRAGAVTAGPPAEEALEPLSALLRAADGTEGPLGVAPGLRPTGGGWFPAAELTDPRGGRLAALVAETQRRWDAPPHVAAALWWKNFSYWTTLPVAMGWALNRRVPVLTAGNVLLSTPAADPGMLIAMGEPRVAAGDAAELGAVIAGTLLRDLQAPVIEALHALTRAGRRGLWGSVAEALVHPLVTFGAGLLDEPGDAARTLLESVGAPVAGLIELPALPELRRRTCCLWVTLGQGICPTCCVTDPGNTSRDDERRSAGARS
ncbi:hypothetical protein ACN3XK_27025 [Actinomadura welshii]